MKYSGINAKIGAMRGKLLDYDGYAALAASKTVEDLCYRLKELPAYTACMEDIDAEHMHRGFIEQRLGQALYEDYTRLYSFIEDFPIRRFLDAFFLKHEILVIKLLLCMIYDQRESEYNLNEMKLMLGKRLHLDIPRLLQCKTVADFIDSLEGSPFYKALYNVYSESTTLYQLEVQLDLYYYLNLWKLLSRLLDEKNRKIMKNIIGTEIDLINIAWVSRLKTYYRLTDSLIYASLIPVNYRLSSSAVNRMVEAKTHEEFTAEILGSFYGKYFTEGQTVDQVYLNAMDHIYRFEQVMQPKSIAGLVGYVYSKETEIRNIVSLLEGVRYGLPAKDILAFLRIRVRKEVG